MLKPRKAKQKWQVVKRCFPNSSRAREAVIYLPKGEGRAIIPHESMRNICKQIEGSLMNPSGRNDFFMHSGVVRTVFRMHRAEWMLSWVPGRDHLYHLRKFPLPRLPTYNHDEMLSLLTGWHATPTAETERLSGRREVTHNFDHIGINASRDRGVSSTMEREIREKHPEWFDRSGVEIYTTSTTPPGELTVDSLFYTMRSHAIMMALRALDVNNVRVILTCKNAHALVEPINCLPISAHHVSLIVEKARQTGFGEPTPENLVEWLAEYGKTVEGPKVVDYLGILGGGNVGHIPPETITRMRQLALYVDFEPIFTQKIVDALRVDPSLIREGDIDVDATVRYLKARQADPNAQTFIFDSLSELDKKEDDNA